MTHPPLSFKSYARKRLGCFDRFDRDQCLRFLAPFFFVSADSRLSIPYENFFADSVFVSIGICIKPVDFSSVDYHETSQDRNQESRRLINR